MKIKSEFMKNFKNYILLALGVLGTSCSVDDPLTVEVQDTVGRGAIIRTISIDPQAFLFNDTDSQWTITMEEQDHEDGDLLQDVEVYFGFVDGTAANGTTTATETLGATIPASAFSVGPNGLPRTTYSLSYGEALSALGLAFDPGVVDGGDQISIRLVLNLSDGRSYTGTDLTGAVSGGSFFSSPMAYRINIVCPPKAGTAGTWTIDMQDSYGDGWNGASLDVTIDGTTTAYTFDAGAVAQFTFDVSADAEVLSIVYTSGAFDEENTFQVISPTAQVVLDLGPTPAAGVELLDYCKDF
jgi:hypothetical protein